MFAINFTPRNGNLKDLLRKNVEIITRVICPKAEYPICYTYGQKRYQFTGRLDIWFNRGSACAKSRRFPVKRGELDKLITC